MARAYRAGNKRIIPRTGRGRFRRATLQDIGVPAAAVATGAMTCADCGHEWRPVLRAGICPECGSQRKREDVPEDKNEDATRTANMPPKTYRRGVGIGATHSIKAGREPIQHASSGERRTRTGETYRALCGAAIYENRRETFDPTHQRACPKCVAGAARAAAGEPGDVTP